MIEPESPTILNIAAGKFDPINMVDYEPAFLINVDTMYYDSTDPAIVEQEYKDWEQIGSKRFNVRADVFEFMERTTMTFDRVCIYRFLEHVPMDKVLYFIYLLSTVTKSGSVVDVIVPNYETLGHMIFSETANLASGVIKDFDAHNVLLTTELVNEPSCPHASLWTPYRADHFFQLEGRFELIDLKDKYVYDGRGIYLRFLAGRL